MPEATGPVAKSPRISIPTMPTAVAATYPPQQPSRLWRASSSLLMGVACAISKGFLHGFNTVETVGLERFAELLESRRDVEKRTRGLITVCNHISILDDPLIWGVLPFKYAFNSANLRWSLAAHDICFTNPLLANFFTLGKTIPTYRFKHSPYGGLFQPTMTDAIRLLSSEQHAQRLLNFSTPQTPPQGAGQAPPVPRYPSASAVSYPPQPFRPWDRYGWVHVFPEACVHQEPERGMRYFKWGVARLVLESGPSPPDVVPMFIDGTDQIMSEDRTFPRFLPRVGRHVRVVFGEPLDYDAAFGDLKRRWDTLVAAATRSLPPASKPSWTAPFPEVIDLEHGEEARAIRIEVARRLQDEVLKLRRRLGYPDQDPKLSLAETWAREPGLGYTYTSKVDGSVINEKL